MKADTKSHKDIRFALERLIKAAESAVRFNALPPECQSWLRDEAEAARRLLRQS